MRSSGAGEEFVDHAIGIAIGRRHLELDTVLASETLEKTAQLAV
jgi:hypothetical protein